MTQRQHLGVNIDTSRDSWLNEQALAYLTQPGFYKLEHETSPQETFARPANCFSFGDKAFAQRMYDYVSKGYAMFASPITSNAVEFEWPEFDSESFNEAAEWLEANVKANGMPISCFLTEIADTKQSLVETASEVKWLSMNGGGVGVLASMRSPDSKSTGVMAHMPEYDNMTVAYKQTEKRRGSIAAFMRIDHPEILNFINMRNPVGGDQNKKCFNLNNGVLITDKFMKNMIRGEEYELVDPKHGPTGRFLSAREVWEELMNVRFETGEPYVVYIDTVNRAIPEWILNPHYIVKQSNLCSEITLWTSDKRTAVCCLSSLNMEKYEEWKDTSIVEDFIRFLDNVLEYFIRLAPPEMKKAVYSAKKERALGLGTFGWHSYLQSKSIPFDSGGVGGAVHLSDKLYKKIKTRAVKASKQLAVERGEAPDTKGSGMRNSHLMAVAPNASSASLVAHGPTSPSIEAWTDNDFMAEGRAGSFLIKNKYLQKILKRQGKDTTEVWKSILENDGSVSHLEYLTDHEKRVFATSKEIDPMASVEQVAARTPHVCQSQSFNIRVPRDITLSEMSDIHVAAWFKGVKTMYYCRAEGNARASIGTGTEKPLNALPVRKKISFESCVACEG